MRVFGVIPAAGRWDTLRIVLRDVGSLQVVIGVAMLLPCLVSILYGEMFSAASFLIASAITGTTGWAASRVFHEAGEPERYHAMIVAGAGWLVTALFGSLPFLIAAHLTPPEVAQGFVPSGASYASSLIYFRNPLHAVFESMSAFTTTGLTMAVHEPSIGHGLLFYRSFGQWIGGVGVIVLSLAIVPRPRLGGGLELYQSESSGGKIRPSILGTTRAIWKIYVALTAALVIYLFLATVIILPGRDVHATLFEAVNHAMTGLATGGFSPLDDNIAGYGSYAMELVLLVPMLLGVVAIPLHYLFLRHRELGAFKNDPQVRLLLLIIAVVTPLVVVTLLDTRAVSNPVRDSLFQVVSGLSGTGWQTSDIGNWSASAVLLLAGGTMIVGGSAGSTAGGFKLIRAYVLLRSIVWRVRKMFLPTYAVLPFRLGTRRLPVQAMHREVSDAATISFLYLAVLGASLVLAAHLTPAEFTLADALFESISAQGTVGLSTGITHPDMPASLELLFVFQMWVGRLEIFPVLVLIRAIGGWIVRR